MNEYEVLIETINPCGGEAHANKEFKEIEADKNAAGDTVITTGDGKGTLVRYTFTE